MSSPQITCPQCRASLRSQRPIVAGSLLRCPECGEHLDHSPKASPGPPPLPSRYAPVTLPRSPFLSTFLLAVLASCLLLTVGAGAAFLFLRPQAPPPVVEASPAPTPGVAQPVDSSLEDQRRELAQERQRLAQERRHLLYERVMEEADAALDRQEYSLAEKAYTQALELTPGDGRALQGLVAARSALVLENKSAQEGQERDEQLERLLTQGKEAREQGKLADALERFQDAGRLAPEDPRVALELGRARMAVAENDAEKKKQADYQARMEAGRLALLGERYADAIREYAAALQLAPGDEAALKGQRQAEARLGAVQDLEKRRAARLDFLDQGRRASRDRRFNDAVQAYQSALKLFPDDAEARRELQDIQKEMTRAQRQHKILIAQAEQALLAQRFEEAHRLFSEADRLLPDDPEAGKGLARTARLIQDFQAAQAAYFRFMTQGSLAMQSGRFADAVLGFREALRLVPTDAEAARGLQQAQAELEKELGRRREIDRLIQLGSVAVQQRRYQEAAAHLAQARQLAPHDLRLLPLLRQARYGAAMAQGQAAMNIRRFAEAAQLFEAALREVPTDGAARLALQQARALAR